MWAHDIDARSAQPTALASVVGIEAGTSADRGRRSDAADRRRPSHVDPTRRSSASRRRATRPRRRSWPARRDVLSSVVSSQVDLHARYGGVVPEIASRAHVELLIPVVAAGAGRGGRRRAATSTRSPPRPVPASSARCSSACRRPRPWRSCGTCPSSASTTSRPTSTPPSSRSPTSSCPLVVLLVSGGHTMLDLAWRTTAATGCSARRSTTPPARRSTRSPASSASATPAARRSTASPWRATRRRSTSRGRCSTTGYDFSFSGLKTAVDQPRPQAPRASPPPTWRRRSRQAVVDVLVTKARRAAEEIGAKGLCLGGGVAANSLLREQFLDRVHRGRHREASCPAGRCAPTTPPWSPRPAWHRLRLDGPSPLDAGADPNLKLPRLTHLRRALGRIEGWLALARWRVLPLALAPVASANSHYA